MFKKKKISLLLNIPKGKIFQQIPFNKLNMTPIFRLSVKNNSSFKLKTSFNPRLNIDVVENRLEKTITEYLYNEQYKRDSNKIWVTFDGPPFTSGTPHLGILYNKILKDTINRIKILQGYKVHYQIGFDCNGIHIEDQVMAKIKVSIFK
jgi:isoleucyl-tRNA synthetase